MRVAGLFEIAVSEEQAIDLGRPLYFRRDPALCQDDGRCAAARKSGTAPMILRRTALKHGSRRHQRESPRFDSPASLPGSFGPSVVCP